MASVYPASLRQACVSKADVSKGWMKTASSESFFAKCVS